VDPLRALENASTVASVSGSGIELALLAGLQPNAIRNVEGQLALEVELRGGSPEPSLVGEIRLTRGGFEIDGVAPRLGPLDARVSFSRNALRIENFALSVGAEGRATLHGEVVLADLQPLGVDLLLELSALPVQQGSALRGSLDGSLTVVGRFDALVATGDLSLRDLRYRLMRERDPLLDEITVRRANDSPAVAKPSAGGHELYTNASVDVRIDLPPVGRVEGQGADLEVSGALRARKAANRPLAVTGAVEVLQGSYRLRGKAFEIERGRAVFTGRADLDPELDARALHRARDVSIFAIVYGRASAPMVRLESDPPFPEQDVLALLLFGKTREELGGAQRGALESALAQTAGGVAVESLEALAGVDIPVDSIEVETSSDSAAPVVGVGRYVTKDVFVRFGQDFGSEGDSEVRIDWRLAPRWSIESRTSSTGNSSADLIWTLDY
jgi:translocation and assembly module TamB